MKHIFNLLIFSTIAITACNNKTEQPNPPNHSTYFPFYRNEVQYFEVKEISIDAPLNIYDTTIYTLSIVTDSLFNSGDTTVGHYTLLKGDSVKTPIGRLVRELSSPVGSYIENWNNCRVVKSLLPIKNGASWNSQIYCITSDSNEFSKIITAHTPSTIDSRFYDSTFKVVHSYDSSLIHLKANQEIWAAGYGLIYSEKVDIISNNPNLDFTIPIRQRIEMGTIFEMQRKMFEPQKAK